MSRGKRTPKKTTIKKAPEAVKAVEAEVEVKAEAKEEAEAKAKAEAEKKAKAEVEAKAKAEAEKKAKEEAEAKAKAEAETKAEAEKKAKEEAEAKAKAEAEKKAKEEVEAKAKAEAEKKAKAEVEAKAKAEAEKKAKEEAEAKAKAEAEKKAKEEAEAKAKAEAEKKAAEEESVYRRRFNRHFDELRWLYMELYGNDSMFAELCDNMERFYHERSRSLKTSDYMREARPDWYKQNDMMGMMFYIDNFAGNMKGVQKKLDYIEQCGVNYIHLMPFLDTPEGRSDGGYAVSDFRKVQEKLGTMEDLEHLTAACHEKDINVCMDFVMNHTSEDHEWAKRARQGDGEYMGRYFFFDIFRQNMNRRFLRYFRRQHRATLPGFRMPDILS